MAACGSMTALPCKPRFVHFDDWEPPDGVTILLCTKCYDNAAVLARLPQGAELIPIQNGFDPRLARLRPRVGRDRVVRLGVRTRPAAHADHAGGGVARREKATASPAAPPAGSGDRSSPLPPWGRGWARGLFRLVEVPDIDADQAHQAHVQRGHLAAGGRGGDRQRRSSSRFPTRGRSSSRCCRRTTAS